jgi:hypothetical protein
VLRRAKVADARSLLSDLVEACPRHRLGPTAAAVAADILARVANGDVEVRNGTEAAALLRVLYDMARLESGQPTSAALVAHLSTDEVLRRIEELRELRSTSSFQSWDDGKGEGS